MTIPRLEPDCNCGFTSGPCICRGHQSTVERLTAELAQAREELAVCLESLIHLVELKRHKDKEGKTAEYLKQQPVAWENANRIIANLPAEAEKLLRLPKRIDEADRIILQLTMTHCSNPEYEKGFEMAGAYFHKYAINS